MKTRTAKNKNLSQSALLKIIAKNIRHLRLLQDISQETLAEYADLHRNSICLLEKAELNITATTLESLAKALKVSVVDIVSEEINTDKK